MNYKKLLLSLTIILSFCIFLFCKKEVKETSILTVQTVIGDVSIETNGIKTVPPAGYVIKENSIIKTGKLSILDLKYKDNGIIRINENSNINIAKLMTAENKDETVLDMSEGKVFITIAKLLKSSTLQVKTPTSVAGIRGTSFRVSSENGVSHIDVLAGKVKVNPVQDEKIIDTVETFVETNKTLEVDQKDIVKIVEDKKVMEVASMKPEEIANIKEEVKYFKVDETLNDNIKNEIKEIGIESKPAEDVKDNKAYEKEMIEQLEKARIAGEAITKERELQKAKDLELEKQKEKELKAQKASEEKQKKAEKLRQEKAERDKIENEKKTQELEKQKQVVEEKKKEEERVKNIPNF